MAEADDRNAHTPTASLAAASRGGPLPRHVLHDDNVRARSLLDEPTHLIPTQTETLLQREEFYRSYMRPTSFPPRPD